ncbi:replication endonuclease [Aliarcobacter butzleri]|uniref:replication endonuclease n=1 Tax=Aliarcobacter butzleri TaxID=28197 RepID=UPI0021B53DC7|nr:replication endonuclease [Aliarcobacter butzleri]MCT7588229.1 replication endonuclease [Aliarcobacter butzleri]
MTKFEKYITTKSIEYKNISIKKEIDINRFLNNFLIIEKMGQDSFVNISHNEVNYRKDDYYWFMYNQKILENKIISEQGYSTLFLTLTLPSSFHQYSKTSKRYNKKYDEKNTIEIGYKLLNETFRDIYKNFRVDRKFVKVYYSKVFEPHKNFTPHLHSILYVKSEYKDNLIQHIKNMIKKNKLGKSFEIEEIKDLSRSSSYLLKYIRKNTNVDDGEKFRVFNGWKRAHKIRVFTCSILSGLERFLYKKIKNNTNITKNLKENPIIKILNECNITITTNCKTTKEVKTKINAVENAKFTINCIKEKTQIKDKKQLELIEFFVNNLKNNFWKSKNNQDCLLDSSNFDNYVFKVFEDNKRFLKVINSFYVSNFLNAFNFKTFFKDFYNELYKCVKNVHTYKIIDLEIFENINAATIKKYDKKDFYVTNTTKEDNRLKRMIWEIKDKNSRKK